MAEVFTEQRAVRKAIRPVAITEQKAVRKVVRPESTGLEYEIIIRTQRETFQKILWAILSMLFVLLGIYAMLGGSNPFLT